MRFLTRHGEKVVCAIIVVLCGVWAYTSHSERVFTERRMGDELGGLWRGDTVGTEGLSPSYPYQPSRLTPYDERLRQHLDRALQPMGVACSLHTFYPQPVRPEVLPDPGHGDPGETIALPAPGELRLEARQGRVVVICTIPPKPNVLLPIRIEVQRGTSADRIDRTVHVFELGPNKENATRTDATVEPNDGPSSPADTRRTRRGAVQDGSRRKATKPAVELRFEDTDVEARETCYYRARLVARWPEPASGSTVVFVDGKEMDLRWLAEDIERIQDPVDGTTLYAGPWSPVAQATVPTDLQLRYQFVTDGTLPTNASAPQTGYSAFLGVRWWDSDARAWCETSFEVAAGQPIKGRLKFKVGTETKMRELDAGLVLQSVQRATKVRIDRTKELVTEERTGEDGKVIRIPVTGTDGKFVYTERRTVARTPTEVAVMKAPATGREIRLVKGLGFEESLPANVKLVLEGEPEPPLTAD